MDSVKKEQVPYVPFEMEIDKPRTMLSRVKDLQTEVRKLPQYEPVTRHYFHGGMYCREVFREAGVLVIGKVHKKEHFYMIVSGTVKVTTDDGVKEITGPQLMMCQAGTKRAVYAVTDATCLTFHRTDATTIEEAEVELVEDEPDCPYGPGNILKTVKELIR